MLESARPGAWSVCRTTRPPAWTLFRRSPCHAGFVSATSC